MPDAQIFLDALSHLTTLKFSCYAIDKAMRNSGLIKTYTPIAENPVIKRYSELFCPFEITKQWMCGFPWLQEKPEMGKRWSDTRINTDWTHNDFVEWRETALCFAAAMAETGDI